MKLLFPAVMTLSLAASAVTGQPKIDFNRDIRPILSDRCFKCHGPDAKNQKSDFRLDSRENATADLGGYNGIVPGELELSELHHRIRSEDSSELMPPPKSKLALTAEEKDLLDRWITEGAPYDTHWAFKPIPATVPVPEATDWARTPVDAFVLAALEDAALESNPPATPESWLRRVTLDLTGLPPTLDELDRFLADLSDPPDLSDPYRAAVDRLLATDAYAERMTSEWLDVARYSDSYGYQVDRERFVWPWRDWVIRAFKANLSYDRFITEQLAGDLLPNATQDQVLATAFNRLHPQKVEGGSVPEEFRVEYVADRLHTFGTAFLGLTLECARCHDHKYDPVTMVDYYSLSSFFANIDEAGLYSYFTPAIPTPTLLLTTPEQDQRLADLDRAVAEAEATVKQVADSADEAFTTWLADRPSGFAWTGLQAHVSFDDRNGGDLPDRARPDQPAKTNDNNKSVPGVHGQALQLTGDDAVHVPGAGEFTRSQPFSIGLWINTPQQFKRTVIFRRSKAWTDAGSRGYELLLEDGRLSAALVHFYPGNALRVRAAEPLPANEWLHVTMTYDGSSRAAGLRLWLDGEPLATEVVRDYLTKNIEGGGDPDLHLGERFRDVGFQQGLVDELHVFARELTPLEVAQLHDGSSLASALATPADRLDAETRAHLRACFLATAHPPSAEALAALQAARDAKRGFLEPIAEIMVMRESATPRKSHVLERGHYSARGAEVAADTPAALPPFPGDQPRNRLGLARWLTDPAHPLTARVTVNRYWQMFFGHGLVRTPEDFGSQGRPPTHPELLDWLARDFIAHDWDLRHLVRTIVLSATYRQESRVDPDKRKRDPENRLLARGPAERLTAEMIRDQALAASGLLVRKVGGPPVKPYEVEVSFKPEQPDQGEGLYRRSLYTRWQQNAPPPAMMTLNASKREVCRVRREATASPLQTFVLLNGPQYLEASRVMGARLLERHAGASDALVVEAHRALTSRTPTKREAKVLRALYDEQLAHFQAHPEQAAALLTTGQAPPNEALPDPQEAAAAVLVNAIMNLHEAVTKR